IASLFTSFQVSRAPQSVLAGCRRIDADEPLLPVAEAIQLLELGIAVVALLMHDLRAALFEVASPAEPLDANSLPLLVILIFDLFERLRLRPHHNLLIDTNSVNVIQRPTIAPAVARAILGMRHVVLIQADAVGEVADDAELLVQVAEAPVDRRQLPPLVLLEAFELETEDVAEGGQVTIIQIGRASCRESV